MSRVLTLDAKVAVLRGQDHYWRVILELHHSPGYWTIRDIDDRSNGDRASVRDFVRRLATGGYAEIIHERPAQGGSSAFVAYRLVKTSREAPRLTRDGRELPEARQESLWRAMKLLKRFTAAELFDAAVADDQAANRIAGVASADDYCKRLARAGVLVAESGGIPRKGKAVYRLLKGGLGPIAPKILATKHVYDANSNIILGVAEAREAS